jgi:hypothetical protein
MGRLGHTEQPEPLDSRYDSRNPTPTEVVTEAIRKRKSGVEEVNNTSPDGPLVLGWWVLGNGCGGAPTAMPSRLL